MLFWRKHLLEDLRKNGRNATAEILSMRTCRCEFSPPAAGDMLRRSPVRRALDAVTGTVLIALGIRLATEQP